MSQFQPVLCDLHQGFQIPTNHKWLMKQAVKRFVADTDAESLRNVAHHIRRYAERYVAQNDGGSLGTRGVQISTFVKKYRRTGLIWFSEVLRVQWYHFFNIWFALGVQQTAWSLCVFAYFCHYVTLWAWDGGYIRIYSEAFLMHYVSFFTYVMTKYNCWCISEGVSDWGRVWNRGGGEYV